MLETQTLAEHKPQLGEFGFAGDDHVVPYEVAPLFREWLVEHFPDRAAKVMSHLQSMRGGRDNDPNFGSRMRGQGPYAELIRIRFEKARRRHGLHNGRIALRTDLFVPPSDQGRLF